ncbi:MAG: hypothetical protein G8345_16595 [Magnetococcales bacterium]|nr:ubiquinol-cytochrome C chaperone family protein [Magnetococcales bacterium]NGZ28496.1 hypothetical protein [Magnetococcales bacterium]
MGWLGDMLQERQKKQRLHQWALTVHDHLASQVLKLAASGSLELKDGFELRFELMVLAVTSCLFRLHKQGEEESQEKLAALWEITFEGLEYSLRERGVNDIRIAARMRRLFQDATGRRNAYLTAWQDGDGQGLRAAIARNVLNGAAREDPRMDLLEEFLLGVKQQIALD